MNKIVLDGNLISIDDTDDSIEIILEDASKLLDVTTLNINVLRDTDLTIIYNFLDNTKLDININILKNVKCNLTEYRQGKKCKLRYKYNLDFHSFLNVIKINDVHKIKELVVLNLNKKFAKVRCLLKTIAKNEEKYDYMVYHNEKNTESDIINNGVAIEEGQIKFDVSGFVPNSKIDCIVNQNNRIINLTNNKCEIKPNLFIDENDVIANHSAHIGKCREDEMFYLKSRGICEKNAEYLLIRGFLMQKLENEKETMEKIISKYWR